MPIFSDTLVVPVMRNLLFFLCKYIICDLPFPGLFGLAWQGTNDHPPIFPP